MEVKAAGCGRKRRSRATSSSSSASSGGTTATAVERKEAERKRRQHMKDLSFKLLSLVPKHHSSASKETMTQLGNLDEAAAYIKNLKERVDELHHKKLKVAATTGVGSPGASVAVDSPSLSSGGAAVGSEGGGEVPVVEVRYHEDGSSSYLDVVLVCGAESPFKFHEVITVLEEEGAEILNANFSIASNKFFYTIHSRAFSSRIGIEVSRVSERLRALV